MDSNYLNMDWQNGFEATLDARVVLSDTYIPMTPVPESDFGRLVLEDTSKENFEVIRYSSKDAHGVFVETVNGGIRNEDGNSTGIHPRGARIRANITAQDLREFRAAAKAVQDSFATFSATQTSWFPVVQPISSITSLGQKVYQIQVNGVDLRSNIGPTTRIKATRTVVPATVQGRFRFASSRNAAKTTGLTGFAAITDTVTIQAKVNLTGYRDQAIVSARGGSVGFDMVAFSDGTIRIHGNLSSGNYKLFRTKMAHPTNRPFVITMKLQMSTGQAKCFFDGVDVPLQAAHAGTANSMAPSTRVDIGTTDGTSSFLDGTIQDVAIYNAYLADATILDRLDKTLAGNETNLVSYWKFNETSGTTVNDATTNANHLTATNADVLNNSGNFMNAVEMGIVSEIAYTGGNSILTVYGGSLFGFPTSGGMTGLSWSNHKTPSGFPADKVDMWGFDICWYGGNASGVPTTLTSGANNLNNWLPIGFFNSIIPKGGWSMDWRGLMTSSSGSATTDGPRMLVEFSDVNPQDSTRPFHRQNSFRGNEAHGATGTSTYGVYYARGSEEFYQATSALYSFYAVTITGTANATTYFEGGSVRVQIRSKML